MLDAEFVICPRYPRRALKLIKALASANNCQTVTTPSYSTKWLFMWGAGGALQMEIAAKHKGMVAFFDFGYFGRSPNADLGHIRLTINDPHPQKYLSMIDNPAGRFVRTRLKLQNFYNPEGHILLCGMGRKSRDQYGFSGNNWERGQIDKIRKLYPDRDIVYRSKPKQPEVISGTRNGNTGSIEQHLKGCALVVCYHSNVSVDCAVYGVPCVSFDGAGVYLWGTGWPEEIRLPSEEERYKFLERVAWFDWSIGEAPKIINFIAQHEAKIAEIAKKS